MTGQPASPVRASVFEHANEAMLITDARHRILDANPAFTRLTGLDHDRVVGRLPDAFCIQVPDNDVPMRSWQELHLHHCCRAEVHYRNGQGSVRPALMSVSRVHDEAGDTYHHVIQLIDLAEMLPAGRQASREVYFDALTGLPNLHLLTQLIQESMQHVRERGGELVLCTLDIDHFKRINERLGHEVGDTLLATFANRISHLLHGDDVVARIGGDEFVLLLHHVEGEPFFTELLEAIRQPLVIEGHVLRVTASLGVSRYPCDEVDGDVLLRHANQAMYRAKQRGRNTFHLFDPDQDRQLQLRQERRQRVAEALARDELRLFYQPQIDMFGGRVVGLEALVRWQHPEEGLLAPNAFLPIIEGSSLESLLGEWVLEAALKQQRRWLSQGIELPVHVNISPAHLLSGTFPERLGNLMARYPEVPARLVKLEVLESAAMHDIQAALDAMRRCRVLGIDFAIDDFGTGFSSLTHLRQLPVDLIKIDQSFVRDMLADPDDMAIVESVIFMANRFRRPMLAEGVETLEHARALVRMGCSLAQGYGIARPMPSEVLPTWLEEWQQRHEWTALSLQASTVPT
ncbi:putative bifunctional diguanylate cyclase/phosphodiesterase [Halomonas campaniensis]|uniref:putative bifunctional diguanylate cyclase/phosphodiesterase n=1 Tax=Halomonas campaniensis TaxID=213554 RepID=UPI003561CE7F